MSLALCIPDLIENGTLSGAKADEAWAIYTRQLRAAERDFGEAAAASIATEKTLAAMEAALLQKKRVQLLQMQAQMSALGAMRRYGGGDGLPGGGPIDHRAAAALFDRDGRAPYANVEARRKAVRGRAHGMIDGILAKHSRNIVGEVREKAELVELVDELFGVDTGNANARELAGAWSEAAEMLRRRFNAAGGDIGKLERWGLPQSHDARAVRAAGFDAWSAFITPRLDRARMVDEVTGASFDDAGLQAVLRDVFETIRTDGWSKREAGTGGRASRAASRQEHRFLHFADAAAWTDYAEAFGQGTAFDAMMGHIDGMATDIALMELLGPNPDATVRWLGDTIEKSAAEDAAAGSRAIDRAHAGKRQMQRLFDEITGTSRRPESRAIALGFSTVRSLQTAAKLGSATLSATSDVGFQLMTRRFNGLPAASTLTDYARLLNPAAVEDRKLAVRLGLIAEEWSSMAAAQHRYLNEELTGEVSRRMAEGVLRASGLSAFTQAGRWAFGMEFLSHITGEAAKGFDALEPGFRRALERNGLGAAEWDVIRATRPRRERGADWIFPADVPEQWIGDRVLEMIAVETDFAVPTADLRTRAMMNSVAARGTWIGEISRSALLFKSFGISVMVQHGSRVIEQGLPNGARYAAGLFVALTLGGAIALQLKETAKGKDPRPANTPEFWGAAVLQGGGFGIFGDFLGAAENRFGGGLGQTLAGPLAQTASNVGDLTIGNVQKAVRGDETDVGKDVNRLLRSELPGGSLWYSRLAFERLVLDEIQEATDPDWRDSWRRIERRAREQGQDYFWAPGDTSPERAPDFSNINGETPR